MGLTSVSVLAAAAVLGLVQKPSDSLANMENIKVALTLTQLGRLAHSTRSRTWPRHASFREGCHFEEVE